MQNTDVVKRYYFVSYRNTLGAELPPLKVESGYVLTINELPELEYSNYKFNGWYLDDTLIKPESNYKVESDIILDGEWTGNSCEIKFTHTDNVTGQDFIKILEYGTQINLPESAYGEKSGLEFKGWYCNGVFYPENYIYTINGNVTFVAYYVERGTHSISYYHVVDGVLLDHSEAEKFEEADSLTGVENPLIFTESSSVFISGLKNKGYTFEGWYTSHFCQYEAVTYWQPGSVNKDIDLYAKWTTNSYTINFEANGGSLKNESDPQISGLKAKLSDTIVIPECKYELSGCEFVSWSIVSDEGVKEFMEGECVSLEELYTDSVTDTITLYAHWRDSVPPVAPENFEIKNIGRSQITLGWTFANEAGIAYTRLFYRKKGDSYGVYVDFSADNYIPGSDFEYTVEGLEIGKAYTFKISSYDLSGNSNNFDASCILVAAPRAPAYIPLLALKQTSVNDLEISWEAPDSELYPMIEKISVVVNNSEVGAYYSAGGKGDCYDKNSFTFTGITALSLYTVRLELSEEEDEAGATNFAKTLDYDCYTEPDFNTSIEEVNVYDQAIKYWKYSDSLAFSLGPVVNQNGTEISEDKYTLYAKCTPLDADGNEILRNTTIKALQKKADNGLYVRNALEPSTTYNISIMSGAKREGSDEIIYSNCLAQIINNCQTASKNKAEIGYVFYDDGNAYCQVQVSGNVIGVVTETNSFNEAKTIVAIDDIPAEITDYTSAKTVVESITDGNLFWTLPGKTDIEQIFNSTARNNIFSMLEILQSRGFSSSTIKPDGTFTGKYLTQTPGSTANTVLAFDICGSECSSAQEVYADGSGGSFRVRPFAVITTQD